MKDIHSFCFDTKKNSHSISLPNPHKLLKNNFSERDILFVQKTFLTPGFHCFHVLHLAAGRLFIQQFLRSLQYYNNIGFLTATNGVKDDRMRDILEELQENGYLYEPYFLDEFFIDNFDYDFIWIETTAQLCTLSWYFEFHAKLQEYNITSHIPIIILTYEQV